MSPKGAYPSSLVARVTSIASFVIVLRTSHSMAGIVRAFHLRALGGFLGIDGSLLAHGGENDDVCCLSVAYSPSRD